MPGRSYIRQPCACKEGWTDAHEHLIHLYIAFSLKSEATALFHDTKLISDDCAFPDTLCYYAHDRTYAHLQKKGRGTLTEPEFDTPLIYQTFKSNDIITALGKRANGIEDIPSDQRAYETKTENQLTTKTPKNQTMPKPSRQLLQSADDLLVDASFSNTKDIEVDDMNDKMQQVTMNTPPRNMHRGGRDFTKQALTAVEWYLKHGVMYVLCTTSVIRILLGLKLSALALVVMTMAQKVIPLFI